MRPFVRRPSSTRLGTRMLLADAAGAGCTAADAAGAGSTTTIFNGEAWAEPERRRARAISAGAAPFSQAPRNPLMGGIVSHRGRTDTGKGVTRARLGGVQARPWSRGALVALVEHVGAAHPVLPAAAALVGQQAEEAKAEGNDRQRHSKQSFQRAAQRQPLPLDGEADAEEAHPRRLA